MTCPPFLLAGVAGILTGWSSGRMHERTWHITIGLLVAIVGFVLAASTLNTAGRYVACFIFPMGAYSVNSVIIGWASSTLSQTREKKAVVLAMTNVGGQVSFTLLLMCNFEHEPNMQADRLHLRRIPVARLRQATLRHWFWCLRCLRLVLDRMRLGDSDDAHQREPTTTRFHERACQPVRILVRRPYHGAVPFAETCCNRASRGLHMMNRAVSLNVYRIMRNQRRSLEVCVRRDSPLVLSCGSRYAMLLMHDN
jgi:hypothetical protein